MSEPTAYARLSGSTTGRGVVLVAQAAYHLDDLLALRDALDRRDIDVTIACPLPRPSRLRRWRSSWWRHLELIGAATRAGLHGPSPTPVEGLLDNAAAVLVRNDWGVTRVLVEAALAVGMPTIGWVEGVQDFGDADTGRQRRAYRTVDHVLCLGEYDRDQLAGADVTVVGSERIWRAWHGPATAADGPMVANVNFADGVLQSMRTPWVKDVLAVARSCPSPLVLSRHPADRGHRGRLSEERAPIELLLAHAPRLISRFSTICYEALVRGVELTYHNPHAEQVPTFARPAGALQVTRTRAELRDAVSTPTPAPAEVRRRAESFLRHHLVLDDPAPSERAATRLVELLGRPGR